MKPLKIIFNLVGVAILFVPAWAEKILVTYRITAPSTVGFHAYAFLHDFKGETSDIEGKFELDLDHLENPGRGAIEVDAKTLNTKNRQRDRVMREEHLETAKFPKIRFVVLQAKLDSVDAEEKKADYILTGELDLHGVRKTIEFLATLDFKDPKNLKIVGEVPLLMSDFDIPIPSLAAVIRVKNKVKVSFQLTASPS